MACTCCGKEASAFCSSCNVPYCSVSCQRQDWPSHKLACLIGANFETAPYTAALVFPNNVRIIWDKKQPLGSAKREIEKDKGSLPGQRRIFFTVNPGETFKYLAKRLADTEKDRARDGEAFWQKKSRASTGPKQRDLSPTRKGEPLPSSPEMMPTPPRKASKKSMKSLAKKVAKRVKKLSKGKKSVATNFPAVKALLDPYLEWPVVPANKRKDTHFIHYVMRRVIRQHEPQGVNWPAVAFISWLYDHLFPNLNVFITTQARLEELRSQATGNTTFTLDPNMRNVEGTSEAVHLESVLEARMMPVVAGIFANWKSYELEGRWTLYLDQEVSQWFNQRTGGAFAAEHGSEVIEKMTPPAWNGIERLLFDYPRIVTPHPIPAPVQPKPAAPVKVTGSSLVEALTKLRTKFADNKAVLQQKVAELLAPHKDNEELMMELVEELETKASLPRQQVAKEVQLHFITWICNQLFSVQILVKNEEEHQKAHPAEATGTQVILDPALRTSSFLNYAIRITATPNQKLAKYLDRAAEISEGGLTVVLAKWMQERVGTVRDFTSDPFDEDLLDKLWKYNGLVPETFEEPKVLPPVAPVQTKVPFADVQADKSVMQRPEFSKSANDLFDDDDIDELLKLRDDLTELFMLHFQEWFFHPDRDQVPATLETVGRESSPGRLYKNFTAFLFMKFETLLAWAQDIANFGYGDPIGLTLARKFHLDTSPHERDARPSSEEESE